MGTPKFVVFLLVPTAPVLLPGRPQASPRHDSTAHLSVHPEANHGVPGAQAVGCLNRGGEIRKPALPLPVFPPVVALPDHEVHDCGLFSRPPLGLAVRRTLQQSQHGANLFRLQSQRRHRAQAADGCADHVFPADALNQLSREGDGTAPRTDFSNLPISAQFLM